MQTIDGMENNPVYTDVMIDLETTHTLPDRGAILQIAAVKFNHKTGEVSHNFFERCLTIPPHRGWSEGTRAFWMKQKPSILKDIMSRSQDWRGVMIEFNDWLMETPGIRMWSKPSHFDYNFLSSYFHDMDMIMPLHYRDARDLNSYIEGLHYPNAVPDIAWKNIGDAHNALNDTLMQLQWLFDHINYKDKGVKEAEIVG